MTPKKLSCMCYTEVVRLTSDLLTRHSLGANTVGCGTTGRILICISFQEDCQCLVYCRCVLDCSYWLSRILAVYILDPQHYLRNYS